MGFFEDWNKIMEIADCDTVDRIQIKGSEHVERFLNDRATKRDLETLIGKCDGFLRDQYGRKTYCDFLERYIHNGRIRHDIGDGFITSGFYSTLISVFVYCDDRCRREGNFVDYHFNKIQKLYPTVKFDKNEVKWFFLCCYDAFEEKFVTPSNEDRDTVNAANEATANEAYIIRQAIRDENQPTQNAVKELRECFDKMRNQDNGEKSREVAVQESFGTKTHDGNGEYEELHRDMYIINNIDASSKKEETSNPQKGKILSKVVAFITAFCGISGLTGVTIWGILTSNYDNSTEQESMADESISLVQSEKSYKEYLTNNIGTDYRVTDYKYADFDFNNTYEMFAIADKELESVLYYVDSNGLLKLDEWRSSYKPEFRFKMLNLEQQSFVFLIDGARLAGHKGDLWTVYNEAPCQVFSRNVSSFDENDYNEIIIRETFSKLSSREAYCGLGITMKPYYFYYSDGKLFEYGGKIKYGSEGSQPPKEFLNYPESAEILEEIDNRGFYVVNYLFRANNTITLNLEIKDRESLKTGILSAKGYETYRIVDNSLVFEDSGSGSNYLYPYCFVPEVAVY